VRRVTKVTRGLGDWVIEKDDVKAK